LERDGLMLGDRSAEGMALLSVAHRKFESADGDPARSGRHVDSADFDTVHHLEESLPRSTTQDVVCAGHIPVEDELGGVNALVTQLVDLAGYHESGCHLAEAGWLL